MPRFYVDGVLAGNTVMELPDHVAKHVQVLRLQAGEPLTLFNGQGGEYAAHIESIGKRHVSVVVTCFDPVSRESPLQLTLVQALSAADRMDYTVQKACESGVTTIQVVQSAYCSYRLGAERVEKRLAHWRGIAIAAAEQCGRTLIPQILAPVKFDDWLMSAPAVDLKLLLSPTGAIPLAQLPSACQSAQVLIGPEGGFSDTEEANATSQGFVPLMLGPRIFRTESVAPVISALLQARYGDF